MIDTRPKVERALLVGAPRRGTRDVTQINEHLDELASLADTAGAEVVGRLSQRVVAPTPNYYVGAGKVEELRELAQHTDASLVVFDEELSPAQGKNLEAALQRRVMDRPELILDIFATRARSKEARMQVELAQLEYLLPRLARMWVHLSRIRGGIGLRGPGETQLETDRRMIRKKISTLKKKLEDVAQHREIMRHGRREILTAVLVGYTNAGKSSLLRAMTGADAFVENRLFATLDTQTREVDLRNGSRQRIRMIDTVGFIRKLPHNLVASFRATLEEVARADVLLHVIDASHEDWEDQADVVTRTLADLQPALKTSAGERRFPLLIHVFNKMDLLPEPDVFRARISSLVDRAVFVAAERGDVRELAAALRAA